MKLKESKKIILKYFGHSCFIIDFDGYSIALDPFSGVPGYKDVSICANEVLCSHEHGDHNFREGVRIIPKKRPDGLKITEINSFHDSEGGRLRGTNTLRIFEYEGQRIMHCGDLGVMPDENQLLLMKELDLVLIPVGGTYTFDAEESKAFCDLIRPRVIIPMHYKTASFGFENIGSLDEFTRLYEEAFSDFENSEKKMQAVSYVNSNSYELGSLFGVVVLKIG